MLPGDLDLSGWDLRKALGLFDASNAALFEHVGSNLVYRDQGGLLSRLRALLPQFCNPIAIGHHYLGLAKKTREIYLGTASVNVKKLLYVLRPIAALMWIEARSTMPPTRFDDVLAGVDLEASTRGWLADLQTQKAALREGYIVTLDPDTLAWIDARIAHFGEAVIAWPHRRGRSEDLDRVLAEMLRDPV